MLRTAILEIATLWLVAVTGFAKEVKQINIIDESGQPIRTFQCLVQWKTFEENGKVNGSINWKEATSDNGFVNIDIENLKNSSKENSSGQPRANGLSILLIADGYAPECIHYEFKNLPDDIILEEALTVYLEKTNETVSGHPVVAPTSHISELFYQREFPLPVKKVNTDRWKCQLKKGQSYIIGWRTQKSGWFSKELDGYCSEPFTVEEDGQTVSIDPGMPVTFEYDLSGAPDFLNVRKYPVHIQLYKTVSGFGDEKFWFAQKATVETKNPKIVKIPGLSAGTYYLAATNSPEDLTRVHLDDRRQITLSPEAPRIKPVYPTLDTTTAPGDVSITGIVLDVNQNPIPNEQVSLWLQRYDENKRLISSDIYYHPVQTDMQGNFEFKGVAPGRDVVLNLANHQEAIFLARNSLKENAEIELSFVVGQKNEVVTAGKPFPFPKVRLENNDIKSLNEFKGKIIVIDLWASWCSPCLQSMPKLSEVARQMQSNEIQFITLSIDSDQQAWKRRLTENNWPCLLHTWFDDTLNTHRLKHKGGIPFCIIVDKDGMVQIAGNEADIKAEIERIQTQENLRNQENRGQRLSLSGRSSRAG